jgi:ribosomal protein S18 acetylase RimI-like enzyme
MSFIDAATVPAAVETAQPPLAPPPPAEAAALAAALGAALEALLPPHATTMRMTTLARTSVGMLRVIGEPPNRSLADDVDIGHALGCIGRRPLRSGYASASRMDAYGSGMAAPIDRATMRRLLLHEAAVHAVPGRVLRDFGDCLLLHDPVDAEPFWNRLEAVDWPEDAEGFDRRLAEIGIVFARIARQPHVWGTPPHDRPRDLIERLRANGFEDIGPGFLMWTREVTAARATMARVAPSSWRLERHRALEGDAARAAAQDIVGVLLEAFAVEPERGPGIVAETLATLADPRFTHYLVRIDGVPVAVARRATFDGLSYLSSIGTTTAARGQGLGRLVTAAAMVDGAAAGSELIHLGVFADNPAAIGLYAGLGFQPHGEAGPDMVFVG